MANKNLTTNYLSRLSMANHDGVTQQICDRLTGFTTDNAMLTAAVATVVAARQAEDIAYKHFSGKDFASDDLKREDGIEDKYMSTAQNVLNGLLNLPETEPMYRKAQLARQVLKDFDFSIKDGYEAEARKVLNMAQQWAAATEYTLQELGIQEWIDKAVVQAQKVLQLVTVRVDHESAKVKGELADARKVTDAAIRKAYDVLNALCVLAPSAELSALVSVLFGIEERAKLYYIGGGASSGGNGNSGQSGQTGQSGEPGQTGTGTESGGTESGGTQSGGTESGGTESGGTESGGTQGGDSGNSGGTNTGGDGFNMGGD